MATSLPLLDFFSGVVLTGVGLGMVNIAFVFTMNPTAAEMANAMERRGTSCYSTVPAVSHIGYSVDMMASNASTSVSASALRLKFVEISLCVSLGLLICAPLLLRKNSSVPEVFRSASVSAGVAVRE
jgi:hypothetical protein